MVERDWTAIFRRVKSKPIFMKDGRPSSALFKDSKGVLVDRDAGRFLWLKEIGQLFSAE